MNCPSNHSLFLRSGCDDLVVKEMLHAALWDVSFKENR
jgi:hypothetical protein